MFLYSIYKDVRLYVSVFYLQICHSVRHLLQLQQPHFYDLTVNTPKNNKFLKTNEQVLIILISIKNDITSLKTNTQKQDSFFICLFTNVKTAASVIDFCS